MSVGIGRTDEALERYISASEAEFARGLETAFPGAVSATDQGFAIDIQDARLEIEVRQHHTLRIGLLALPRLHAIFRFTRGTPDAHTRLLTHLDRSTHRGGG